MTDVVTFKLELRAVGLSELLDNAFDVFEGIAKDEVVRLHISGFATSGAASRSSSVMVRPPPVVMLMTASVLCLITGRKFMNTAGSGVGDPSTGLRACRWMIAAPASAASIEDRAISSGVIGR